MQEGTIIKMGILSSMLVVALGTLLTAPLADASILYQSVPDLTADVGGAGALCSSCTGRDQVYDPFGLTLAATISKIDFDAYNHPLYFPTDISVEVFKYSGEGVVGSLVFSQTFSPGDFLSTFDFTTGGQPAALLTIAPTGLALASGEYYISFYNPVNYASIQFPGGGVFGPLYQPGGVGLSDEATAFALLSAGSSIPEPSTWLMTLLGFAGLGFAGYRASRGAV